MLKKKTIKYLAKHCNDLSGKTIVVTGSTSGIGLKGVEELAYLNAHVIMAVRNLKKAENAKNEIKKSNPNAKIDIFELDLASFSSIINFVNKISEENIQINGFINNAGVFHIPNKTTSDGYELILGTNYIGTYFLCEKLIPYFLKSQMKVKLVNMSSISYKSGKIDYDDFFSNKKYKDFAVYARSKICLTRYSLYLAEKYKNTNVSVSMAHPGISITPLAARAYGKIVGGLAVILSWVFNSPEKSALAFPLIMSTEVSCGSLVGPSVFFDGWGNPKNNRIKKRAYQDWDRLIDFTEKLINK